ncbi:MAG: sigma-70 family RNA polymerase sigma factor [Ruminococcus flavefaciens]|nr:sigma-70 family RNA polymerase sigma factor [Ruminococcus flavefaciens]
MQKQNFESTVRLYYQSIYNYCLSRLEDIYSAQDCTQETFLVLYKKKDSVQEDNIRAWLYRTADNIIKNYRKVSAKKKESPIEEAGNISYSDCYSEEKPFAEILDSQEIKMLSEHYIDGYDISYVAEKNGKSVPAVYKMFQRLKVKLKKYADTGGDRNG